MLGMVIIYTRWYTYDDSMHQKISCKHRAQCQGQCPPTLSPVPISNTVLTAFFLFSTQAVEDMMWKISRMQHLKRIKIHSHVLGMELLTCCLAPLQELTGLVQLELNFTSDTLDLERVNLPKTASCIIHCKKILGAPSCLPHCRVETECSSRSCYAVDEYDPHVILTIKPKYCLD